MVGRLVESRLVVAAVVRDARRYVLVLLERLDQVPSAHLHRVQARLRGDQVHQPLDQRRRLGPSGPAIGVHRRRVREHPVHVPVYRRDVVRARIHQAVKDRRNPRSRRRQVRAQSGVHRRPQAQDLPVLRRRHLDLFHVVTPVDRRLVVLASRLRPLDGNAQLHRAERRDRLVGIVRNLAPEPAADLRRDNPHLVLADSRDHRGQEPRDVRVLRRPPQRQIARCRHVLRDGRARLHRVRDQPLKVDRVLDDHVRLLERLVDLSARDYPVKRLVPRRVVVNLRRAVLRGRLRVDRRVERLVVNVDVFQRVLRLVAALRHHHRDGVAHVPHLVLRNRRMVRHDQVGVRYVPRARNRVQVPLDVRAGVDREYARLARRRARVDARDVRMGVRTPKNRRVRHARQFDVVRIRGAARYEPGVLTTTNS